jgi:hypothetical protein
MRGEGVTAKVNGTRVLAGSRRLMSEHGLETASLEAIMRRLENEAKTAMLVAADRTPPPSTARVLRSLRNWGISTHSAPVSVTLPVRKPSPQILPTSFLTSSFQRHCPQARLLCL